MQNKKVVITGVGVVTPLGIGKDTFWKNLNAGRSGIKPISLFDTDDLKVKVGGEVTNFNPHEILEEKRLMDLDRSTLLLLCATKLCLKDAKLEINENNTKQTGVAVGTTFGSLNSLSKYDQEALTEGPRFANPSVFPSTVGNSAASRAAIKFKIKGFNTTLSTGMSAGLDAINYARDFIRLDRGKQILVGSVEDLSQQTFMGLYKLDYLSGLHNGSSCSRPFDKKRDGVVLSEGATMFVVQDADTVKDKRSIYAEVLGIGTAFDPARFYRYNSKGTGMKEAMIMALVDAGLEPKDIDCIFANANSTRGADAIEAMVIHEVFGDYAEKIPITAIKSMVGESYSNSGAMAVAAAIGAMEAESIPPIINLDTDDEKNKLNYVLKKSKKKKLSHVMVNAFGPSGKSTSVILKRFN